MSSLIKFISDNGLIAMFIIIMLEYACFPVSSEIVLPFSGAIASHKQIPFLVIIFSSVIAGMIGTSFCYAIGRYGGNALLNRIKRRFPKTEKGINAANDKFNHWGGYAVCFGRMIPICRTYIAFIAGTAKQPLSTYLSYSFLGITIWNIILIGIGYYLKDNWNVILYYYHKFEAVIIPAVLIVILIIIRQKLAKREKLAKTNENSNKQL